ncbi:MULTISPECIES: tetratricopeptide repeat protein [unclassified Paraflavitalea]|uniref:tetratricopeptide repeat protein n=1 Tax=unclassified Paraflavitalea TaxID=2798305 RepID=UPI003D35168F
MKKITVILAFLGCGLTGLKAQETKILLDPQANFQQAKEYYQREQYSLAYPLFRDLELSQRETDRSNQALNYIEIKYYSIVCGLKQNERGAADKATDFISLEENDARVQMMSFHLAEYYFRQQAFTKSIELYEKASIEHLSNKEIAEKKFHQGYGYFTVQQYDKAKPLLDAIRQMKSDPNYEDANYYYGFIAFYSKNYKDALESFLVVDNHQTYGTVAPYYISVIYFMQGDQKKAFDYAEAKLKRGNLVYEKEMQQLVGHGYFMQKEYAKALPFLESYVAKAEKLQREDIYELAYCQYQAQSYSKAVEGFKKLGGKEDSLAQSAMYLLGDSYLKLGQKANARNAFLFCSVNSSNEQQREVSMYNYAKLSFELGYQDIAISELQKFQQLYPNSSYTAEALELQVNLLANSNNYKDALALIEGIKNPTPLAKKSYPRIYYGRATELINDGMLVSANELLTRAESHPDNASVLPLVQFWKGEIAYRTGKIDDAIRYYFEYLKSGMVNGEVNPANAKYNLGYCFLKKENYKQAQGFFEPLAGTPKINSPSMEQDAYLRIADCYYMNRDYKKAKSMYDKVLDFSWPASDYATFQNAMIAGISSSKEKINLLNGISRKYPTSSLIPDANMEIASSYLSNEQFREAIPYLKNVLTDPNGSLKPKAYLRLGIAYYNVDNNADALKQYSTLLQQYPNSPEAEEALENAKVIYVEEGKSTEYVNFARNMGKEVSNTQEEELAYNEAEVQFNNGNFPTAAKKFEDYLAKYPNGKYSLEALYYKSEIYFNQKDWAKASAGYEALGDRAPNKFAEKSLLTAARLNFFDLKNYEKAEKYFGLLKEFGSTQENKMEAMRGLLRSQFQLKKWTEATANAQELLAQKNVGTDDRVLANLAVARSYQASGNYTDAITAYRNVASLSKAAYGAEARYEIANCQFIQNRLGDAEKAAFETINKSGSYEEWVTRAYLLLGDIYMKQKDYFNAKATYKSVVDNAKIESIRLEAERKLSEATAADANGNSGNR